MFDGPDYSKQAEQRIGTAGSVPNLAGPATGLPLPPKASNPPRAGLRVAPSALAQSLSRPTDVETIPAYGSSSSKPNGHSTSHEVLGLDDRNMVGFKYTYAQEKEAVVNVKQGQQGEDNSRQWEWKSQIYTMTPQNFVEQAQNSIEMASLRLENRSAGEIKSLKEALAVVKQNYPHLLKQPKQSASASASGSSMRRNVMHHHM